MDQPDAQHGTPPAPLIDPLIAMAAGAGRLAVASLADFDSAAGIALPCQPDAVVALYLAAPCSAGRSAIGAQLRLRFVAGERGVAASEVPLHLPNGLALTYGQVAALGADFYELPDAPICTGATVLQRRQRFKEAFRSLADSQGALDEARRILAVMQIAARAVDAALREGASADAARAALGDSLAERWNRITGGGSGVSPWIPMGRYLALAAGRREQCAQHALLAYCAGHAVAIDAAVAARKMGDPDRQRAALELAYAMNAFADHFLACAAPDTGAAVLQRAAQQSADDVYAAFGSGVVPPPEHYGVNPLLATLALSLTPPGRARAGAPEPVSAAAAPSPASPVPTGTPLRITIFDIRQQPLSGHGVALLHQGAVIAGATTDAHGVARFYPASRPASDLAIRSQHRVP